jgi:hypothetical protein
MWVKAYIRHKTGDLVDCDLLFKHGKIQEVNMEFFKRITPFENNSELADNIDILKTYKQDISNKFCKYFIKKSIDKEVHLTYLDISYFQYLKLQWQLKKYLIQSNDLKLDILKYVVVGLIGYLIAMFQSKNPPIQSPNNKDNIENTKSKALNIADKKIDSLTPK